MDSYSKNQLVSLPLIIAMIVNPALAEQVPASVYTERKPRAVSVEQRASIGLASRTMASAIVVDENINREQRPGLKESSNGTAVVDIAAASAAGVSHNRYTEFNVSETGLILNNSQAPVLTQLGGWTDGNRRLAGGEASIILNEVTGSNRSNLFGHIEVAGQAAEFVLANQNGITCDGCGFINIPRATLVTGRAQMANGDLDGFTLGNGNIVFQGAGVNASNVDQFDIVTRMASVNANLYGRKINVFTGNDYFSYKDGVVSSSEGSTSVPQNGVSLDIAALGGMYAHSIHLIGTEKGLGVNSEGLIQSVESLEITADGNVRIKNAVANQSLQIASASESVTTDGQIYAPTVNIQSSQDITNTGVLAARDSLSLQSDRVVQQGELYAGMAEDGSLLSDARFNLSEVNHLENTGFLYSAESLVLSLQSVTNDNGQIISGGGIELEVADRISNRAGTLQAQSGSVHLTTDVLDNHAGEVYAANDFKLLIEADSGVDNSQGTLFGAQATSIQVINGDIENQEGRIKSQHVELDADRVANESGFIDAQTLNLNAGSLDNSRGALLASDAQGAGLFLQVQESIDNAGGSIHSAGETLRIESIGLNNTGGTISSEQGELLLSVSEGVDNTLGAITGETLTLDAADLINTEGLVSADSLTGQFGNTDNHRGTIQAQRLRIDANQYQSAGGLLLAHGEQAELTLNIDGLINNTAGASIQAQGRNLEVSAETLVNRDSTILHYGNGALNLAASNADNTAGVISGQADVRLAVSRLDNRNGAISGDGLFVSGRDIVNDDGRLLASDITVTAGSISNRSGLLSASNRLNLQVFGLDNSGGEIVGGNTVNLSIDSSDGLNNNGGAISSGWALYLDAEGLVDNTGVLESEGILMFEADQIVNHGQLLAGDLNLVSKDLTNHDGGLIEAESLSVDATYLHNAGAILSSGALDQDFQLRVGGFLNSGLLEIYSHNFKLSDIAYVSDSGSIIHHGDGRLSVATGEMLDNRTGVLYTAGNLDIIATAIDNRGGEISAGKTLGLMVDTFNNEQGLLQSGGGVTFELAELNNRSGRIHLFSDADSSFTIEKTLDITDGEIISYGAGGLSLTANRVDNTGGQLSSNGDIYLQAVSFLNQQDTLSSAQSVNLNAGEIDNLDGEISGQNVTVTVPRFENHGVVSAFSQQGDALRFYAGELINRGLLESYGVALDLSDTQLDNREGRLLHKGNGALTLAQQTLDNTLGQLYSAGSISISAQSVNNTSGEIVAEGAASLNASQDILNHAGVIQAHANLTLQTGELRNEAEGYVIALGDEADLTVEHLINDAVIQVAHDASINASEFSNTGDLIGTGITLNATQLDNSGLIRAQSLAAQVENLLNTKDGSIQAGELSIVATDLINSGALIGYEQDGSGVSLNIDTLTNTGRIESQGDTLAVQTRILTNSQGLLVASGDESHLAVTTEALDNRDGVLASNHTLTIRADNVVNTDGEVGAERTLVLQAEQLNNASGVISSATDLNITATLLDNTDDGLLVADELLSANVTSFDNTNGRLATSELNLWADELLNLHGLISADHFSIEANSVDNTQGFLFATDSLADSTLLATTAIDNTAGTLQVEGGSFAITTGELTNDHAGQVVHSGAGVLTVTAGRIKNGAESVIAGESTVQLTADTDLINQGSIQTAGNVVIDVATLDNNAGRVLAGGGISIHADSVFNRSSSEQEHGWLSANWIDITTALFNNDQYARVEAAELSVSASEMMNQGLLLATQEQSPSSLLIKADTLSNSGRIESYNGMASVQGGVIGNSGVISQSQGQLLQLNADTINNTGTLAGDAELTVMSEGLLPNQGHITGAEVGAVSLSAATLNNEGGLLSASNLDIQADQLNNLAGDINADTLTITSQTLVNDTATILASNLSIDAGEVINRADTGEQSYISADTLAIIADVLTNAATVQGQQLTLEADTLTNREGEILAAGEQGESLRLLAEQIDNTGGLIETHGEHLSIAAALINQQGTLLHAGGGVLALSDIDNTAGQVATEGSLRIDASEVNNSQGGLIQVAGDAQVSAFSLDNQAGTLVAGQGLSLNVDEVQNTDEGLVLSRFTEADDFLWNGSTWNNQGGTLEIHSADQTLQLDGFDNADGTLYHAATGKLTLETLADWDTGDGVIVSDGNIQVEAQQRFINSGALAADGIKIHAAQMDNRLGSVINAVWMSLDSQYATNFGTIQTEQFSLTSGVLRNEATATGADSYTGGALIVTSGQDNAFALNGNSLENTLGARLQLNSANNHIDGELINQGVVAALGEGELSFNGLVNHQGVVYSSGSITVEQANWDNRQGEVRAEGGVNVTVATLDNTQGIVQAATGLNISAETFVNTAGTVLSENGIALSLQSTLDNTDGAVVAQSGNVTIEADSLLNLRGFIEQTDFGDLALELDGVLDNTGGQINTENQLLISAHQIINNAFIQPGEDDRKAVINALHVNLTAEEFSNAGGYIQGRQSLLMDINQIDNRAGTLIATGENNGSFVLQSELLDNSNGGSVQVFQRDLSLLGVELDNTGGVIDHRGEGLFEASSASVLRNASGVIQSAGDILLSAASIDNTDGAIAGRGVSLTADNTIHNADKGYIAGDTLSLTAQRVDNTNQGIVAAVGEGEDTLTLNVAEFSNHYGTVRNSSTNWDFAFAEIDNENGTIIHTGSGLFNLAHPDTLSITGTFASTGDVRVSASELHSSGNLLADGDMTLDITGALVNSGQAIIRAGQTLNATVGGLVENSGGITAFSGFDLTAGGSLDNSGIIVTDSQDATITASRIINSGDIAHNGTGTFILNTAELDNGVVLSASESAGTLKTSGTLIASRVALNNTGVISASTLQWVQFDTLVNQALGRIEADTIQMGGNAVDNSGQLVATGAEGSLELSVATLSNRGGATLATNSQNQSFMGDVTNAGSIVHAGTGVLKLGNTGVMDITGGTVSTAGTAELSGSITGTGTVSAAQRISITGVDTFTNSGSTLYSQGDIDISAAVNNQQGILIADGILDIDTAGTIENNNGHLQGGQLRLNATGLNNTGGGKILSTGGSSGYISVGNLNNSGGTIASSNGSFSVSTSGTLNNTDGNIQQSAGSLTLSAAAGLDNTSGKVQSAGTLRLRGGQVQNDSNGLLSGSVLDIGTSALTNTTGARVVGTGYGVNRINVSRLTNSSTISAGGTGLSVDVGNTFNNTGGTLAFTGAGSLDLAFNEYQSGASSNIRSNANLALQTTQALSNTGNLSAGGTLSIYAQSFSNAATGHVDSGSILAIDTQGGSFSNAGTVGAALALEVATSDFFNSGTLASDNILRLSMDTLNLGNGDIEAKGLLDLDVLNSVTLSAGESLTSEGSLSLTSAGTITNGGEISANGNLTLNSVGLTNNTLAVISSGATAELNIAGNLSNNGTIESANNLTVNARNVVNNHSIRAGKSLELFADNIINQNNAVLYSGLTMTLGLSGTLDNRYADILSLGTISIEGKATGGSASLIQNTGGSISSLGNMSLSAQSIVNRTEGVSEEYLGLTDTNRDITYVSRANVWGYGAETQEGANLLTGLTITEGFTPNNIPLSSDSKFYDKYLVTEKEYYTTVVRTEGKRAGLISSGGNMAFYHADVINEFGNISVAGNLTAQGAGLASFNTAKDQTDVHTTTYDEYDAEFDVYDTDGSGTETFRQEYTFVGYKNLNETDSVENADVKYGQINVAGSMAASFEQDVSLEGSGSGGQIDERAILVNNTAVTVGRLTNTQREDATVTGDSGRTGEQLDTTQAERQNAGRETGLNGHAETGEKTINVNIVSQLAQVATVEQAQQQQAADSTASPTKERADAGDDFVQNQLQNLIARYTPKPETTDAEQAQTGTASADGAGVQQQALADGESSPVDGTQVDGNTEVIASNTNTEGGNQTLPAQDTDQLANFKERAAEQGKEVVLTPSGQYVMVDPKNPDATGGQSPTGVEISTAPQNFNPGHLGGLYVEDTSPEGQYLVETRPEYTEYGNFLGSDYLLSAIGYNPDKTHKRLGDAFYETQLVSQALVDQANLGFGGYGVNDYDRMQNLMDNAIAANGSMQLAMGIALTADQAASLTDDIVWMVEEVVNGETVLVPRLYLASLSQDDMLANDSALRVGGDIYLESGGDITFNENVRSRGTMNFSADGAINQNANLTSMSGLGLKAGEALTNTGTLQADLLELTAGGDITNLGSLGAERGLWLDSSGGSIVNSSVADMVSGGTLSLTAKYDITNQQGYIEGVDVALTTELGDIVNRTEFEQVAFDKGWGSGIKTEVGEASVIVSHNSLSMDAGNNLELQGSSLSADSVIALRAGNDIQLEAIENKSTYQSYHSNGEASRVSHQVVNIQSGGDLLVDAGRDINAEGTQFNAGGSAQLNAGRDINLNALANVDHSSFSRKNYERTDTVITHTQATVSAGGDASLHAGQDINLTGANVLADGNIRVHAERDTNLVAVTDSEYHYSYERKDKSFGRSETHESESYDEAVTGNNLLAGGKVFINTTFNEENDQIDLLSSRDVNIVGGNISGTDVTIGAGQDVTLVAAEELHTAFERHRSSGLGGISGSSDKVTDGIVRQVGASVMANNDVTILSGRSTTLAASGVNAVNDIEIQTGLTDNSGDLNLLALNDSVYHQEENTSRSFSLNIDSGSVSWSKEGKSEADNTAQVSVGSVLSAENNVTLNSRNDVNIQGSLVNAGTAVGIKATGDINVTASTSNSQQSESESVTRSGMSLRTNSNGITFFDGDRTEEQGLEGSVAQSNGSFINAGTNVIFDAGNDITIAGSNVAAENNISLSAENNINVVTSVEGNATATEDTLIKDGLTISANHNIGDAVDAVGDLGSGDNAVSDASGVMAAADAVSNAGASVSAHLGQTTTTTSTTVDSQEAIASNLVAGGNVTIDAGNTATVSGSTVNAEGNIDIDGKDVNILAADNTYTTTNSTEYLQVGATLQVSSGNASLTVGFSQSESDLTDTTVTNSGSVLNAGGNLNVTAEDELTVTGSDMNATNIALAGHNVTINASEGLEDSSSDSEHLSAGAGVNFGSDGIGFTASMAMGESELDSTTTTRQNSHITATDNLSITSANDTTIEGGNLHGAEVDMNVGNNLTVASVQDIGTVEGSQWDVSASITVGAGVSGGASVGYGETEGSSAWVSEQTSIIGSDSVNINVGGHTQIDGALIANIDENGEDQGNLVLDTGTIGFSDIEDHDEFESFYLNVGFSTGGDSGANSNTGASPDEGSTSWSAEGNYADHDYRQTNYATVGNGNITVRDEPNVDLSGLNRDTDNAQVTTKEDSTNVDVYVSSTAIEAIGGLFAEDDPDTAKNENTLARWSDSLQSIASLDTYTAMGHNVSQLANPEEIAAGWEQAKKTLGVTSEPPPHLTAAIQRNNEAMEAEITANVAAEFGEEAAQNVNFLYDDTGAIAGSEVNGIPLTMNDDVEQQLASNLKVKEDDLARREGYDSTLTLNQEGIDDAQNYLDNGFEQSQEGFYDAFTLSEQNNENGYDLGLDLTGTVETTTEFSALRAPEIEEFEAVFGPRSDVGDVGGQALGIGGVALGGLANLAFDVTTDTIGLGLDASMFVIDTATFGLIPVLGNEGNVGSTFANWAQTGTDDWVSSFGPSPITGGFTDPTVAEGFQLGSNILGGIGLVGARGASVLGGSSRVAGGGLASDVRSGTMLDGIVVPNKNTVTVYRVDDNGFDPRIASDGSIPTITTKKGGERALFVNFGQADRAKEFALVNRNGNATITAVDVDASLLNKLRSTSVHDLDGAAVKLNPNAPLKVDIKAPDQFGLKTPEHIQWLRDAIDPSTVRIIDPKDL
ncbi:hemagglutinin repeat-containing protein [Gilvimarinus polysaccharolyticus]|uniref:hemagglutinin repeat-containing protein n=1 Tax=Gilvimarinus polysaccharolyticus TaxID=863921 RepID=UPI000673B23D|nr:hemagglutinin repeat-containing protein [Gilvimarinus polysaccharolyticus]